MSNLEKKEQLLGVSEVHNEGTETNETIGDKERREIEFAGRLLPVTEVNEHKKNLLKLIQGVEEKYKAAKDERDRKKIDELRRSLESGM